MPKREEVSVANRKFRNYYSVGRLVTKNGHWTYERGEDHCLFSEGRYQTKIKPEDLPPWYVEGYCYHQHGYFSAKGVKDLLYHPSHFTNHIFKDDHLYVSYDKPISSVMDRGIMDARDYDEVLHGWLIVRFIKMVDQYSDFDTTPIKRQINEKLAWYQENWDVHREVSADIKVIFDDVGE
jgi:hypothetical protein